MKFLSILALLLWGVGWAGLSFQASFLYMTPSFDETYFVINGAGGDGAGAPTPNGLRINNPVGFNPGFRLDGRYCFTPAFSFGFRWTHLYATTKERVTSHEFPPQLWPTENIPSLPNVTSPFAGNASSRIGVMYNKGEALFDEEVCHFRCCHLILREAIEWSYIRYHETIEYLPFDAPGQKIQYHAHTKGLGPQLGVIILALPGEGLGWFPHGLGFKAMTTATLITANSKAKLVSDDTLGATNPVTQSSFWRLVPEWHIAFGLNYLYSFSCFAAHVEAGYEMTTYVRGTSKLIFDSATDRGHSFNQYSDFYIHGPFLSCRILF